MDQLALLPFIKASRSPTALFRVEDGLQAALLVRQQPLETPREIQTQLRRISLTSPVVESKAAAPAAEDQGLTGDGAVAGDYFSIVGDSDLEDAEQALSPSYVNDAFRDWLEGVEEQGRVRSRFASDDTVMGENGFSGTPKHGPVDLSVLASSDRAALLQFLLDALETSTDPWTPGGSPPSLQLHGCSFSAAIAEGHLLLAGFLPSLPLPLHTDIFGTFSSTPSPAVSSFAPISSKSHSPSAPDPYLDSLAHTPMSRMIRDHDWSKTLLGPIAGWSAELRAMVSSMLSSPYRECILWGEHRVMLYNDEYIGAAGGKHPRLLGQTAADGWGEIWDALEPIAVRVMNGETVSFVDHLLEMQRGTRVEETYHTFFYQPFRDAQGRVLGIRNLSQENTASVIAARRLGTVRDLVQTTSLARTVVDFADSALDSISKNAFDIPFALLYMVSPVTPKPSLREIRSGIEERLRLGVEIRNCGTLGVPADHPFLVRETTIDLTPPMSRQSSASGSGSTLTAMADGDDVTNWSWPFEEACLRREPIFVEDLGPLAETLEKRGWGDTSRHAVVIPILVDAAQSIPQAIIVLGVNSRTEYDDLHATFFNLIARHVAVGLFAVLTAEMDAKRSDELVRLDKAKNSFFANCSHELRTPLTLILGPLEDVLRSKDRMLEENSQRLLVVQRHATRLLNMVNKLLDFSSLEGGRLQVKFRPVKIGVVTRDLASLFRDAVERAGLQFIVSCDDDPPDVEDMYISLDLWEKVIYNIVGNAVKYTRKGSIEVTLRSTVAEAVLSVRDTGVGIPADDLGRIFERFHRVESTSRTTSGTGIGLAYTLEVVKLLGGQLEVESEPGIGSNFIVRLPRGFTHLTKDQVVHEIETVGMPVPLGRSLAIVEEAESWRHDKGEPAASITSTQTGDSSMDSASNSGGHSSGEDFVESARLLNLTNRTVLVVEDSRDLRAYIASLLSKHYTVVEMPDGQAALEYAQRHAPSLIITDQMMPKMNGDELVAAIRADARLSTIPIIMISAQAGTEARAEALEKGLDDYLCKPFQPRELLARVNVHLQLGIMRTELEKRVKSRTKALIESEAINRALAEKFTTLSAVSPVGILQADHNGQVVYVNPRFFAIVGHPPERPFVEWRDGVWDEDRPKLDNYYTAALSMRADQPVEFESLEIRFKSREDAWGQLDVRAFRDVGGHDAIVMALTDISRQKRVEQLHIQEVERRAADSEEMRRQTEQYLDMSSHELRNPLSGVWQNAEVLAGSLQQITALIDDLGDGKPVEQEALVLARKEMRENLDAVESILICASHQGRIAEDLLQVSKLNLDLIVLCPVPFDLAQRASSTMRMCESEAISKQISMRLEVGDSIEKLGARFVVADPSRLSQILLNFLVNSIKYTVEAPEKQIVVRLNAFVAPPPLHPGAIRVATPPKSQLEDGRVWISVGCEDSGKGLTTEELQRLFARFSQANPKSDQYGGSGLGLYVSKKLVELHGGFIEVESTPGQGSIFRFLIPASITPMIPADAAPLPSLSPLSTIPRPKRAASRPSFEAEHSQKTAKTSSSPIPKHVLVVEDNLINSKILARQLKLAGYFVTIANNGREGLDVLLAEVKESNTTPIEVVLMDIEMPVMGGLEAIKLLREMEHAGEIPRRYPVIAVTGNARATSLTQCLEAGFDTTATKPYVISDLLVKIRSFTKEGPVQ